MPASAEYAAEIAHAALKVGELLAQQGVIGPSRSISSLFAASVPNISPLLIKRFASGPATKVRGVMRLQQAIRSALGSDYQTFLQGSYRNETAIADINDVDIVARKRRTMAGLIPDEWEELFVAIAARLDRSARVVGELSAGDKCVKLEGPAFNADIVPAVAIENFKRDPIATWSWRIGEERANYPRVHWRNGTRKHARTLQVYKPTVRLFKRWASQYDDLADIAPSFYIECAVHAVPAGRFQTYLPRSFLNVGATICSWTVNDVINSVAGDKDVLVEQEWHPEKFLAFRDRLADDLEYVGDALRARGARAANEAWKLAFGDD